VDEQPSSKAEWEALRERALADAARLRALVEEAQAERERREQPQP
jgi:hypothetical protein